MRIMEERDNKKHSGHVGNNGNGDKNQTYV